MLIFDLPFAVANEVVKRSSYDNRRVISSPKNGGNNLFYLGTPQTFIEKFNASSVKPKLTTLQNACLNNITTLQKGQGVKTKHLVSKHLLLSLIPFIKSYLTQYSHLYHNPNFDEIAVTNKLNNITEEYLEFYSDLTFIKDSKQAKPYFKWFNYEETSEYFKIVQEFLVPYMSFLNFEYIGYKENQFIVEWLISYTDSVIYSNNNVEEVMVQSIEKLEAITIEQRETLREALVKLRLGQSQFRLALLDSSKNSCIFTGISEHSLLVASHVKPWRSSNNLERLDIQNGILLTPTFDKLFDKFLITFDENGNVVWSQSRISQTTISLLKKSLLSVDIKVLIEGSNSVYFDYHRKKFYELERMQNVN